MRKLVFAIVLATTLGLPVSLAQGPTESAITKVERKNRVPINNETLRVKLPKATETTLSNGLTVLVLEDHRIPRASIQFVIDGAGSLHEPADTPGLASTTAQMMREGTKTKDSSKLASEVEQLGASLASSSPFGSGAATVSAAGLSDNFDRWLALAADVLLNPAFPAAELDKLKQRLKTNLTQQRSTAAFLANERFVKAVYGSHPAAVAAPTAASIDSLTSERLAQWHRERYKPQNAILAVAGDVKASTLIPKLESALANWKKSDLKPTPLRSAVAADAKRVLLVDRPGSVQTYITMGNVAIDRRDADYYALVVANAVIGAPQVGRLYVNLRQEKGFTYAINSTFDAQKFAGPWRSASEVRTEVTDAALTEYLREIKRLNDEPVADNELEERKRAIVANFALSLENPEQVLAYAVTRKTFEFPSDYWDAYAGKIMSVTKADVQRVARKYIDPNRLQIIAVGDGSKIRGILEKYGPVQVYGIDGSLRTP